MRLHRWNEAITVFGEFIPHMGEKTEIYNPMGFCYIAMDSLDKAMDCFIKSGRIGQTGERCLGLAIIAYKKGKKQEAKDYLQAFRDLRPDMESSLECMTRLEEEGRYFPPEDRKRLEKIILEYTKGS